MNKTYICGGSNFHPFECSHDKHCLHCTWGRTKYHNPDKCALCKYVGFQLIQEPYAAPIRVRDVSHRKLRITVRKLDLQPQTEIPF
mgnify:CR=1 FL=1